MTSSSDHYHAEAHSLLAMVQQDPVQATMSCSFALLQLHREKQEGLYQLLSVPFATAQRLQTDWQAWKRYIRTPELWAHRKKKKPGGRKRKNANVMPRRDKDHGRVLDLAFEATFAGKTGEGYQSAKWYARALEDAFIKGIKPEDLPAHIKACGSLRKMYETALRDNPRRQKRGPSDDDPYFDLGDPEPEEIEEGQGEDQGNSGDPGPKRGMRTDQPADGTPARRKIPIEHSPNLIRKLEKIAQEGRPKEFMITARPSGDGVVLRLPKKVGKQTSTSGWLTVKIQPDPPDLPDCAYEDPATWALPDELGDHGDPSPDPGWTTCNPWEHELWKR